MAVVHGESDPLVPAAQSRAYAARAAAAGGEVAMTVLPGVGHFELIDPRSAAWPVVLDAVAAVR
jgi:acetyl esterase/lipase